MSDDELSASAPDQAEQLEESVDESGDDEADQPTRPVRMSEIFDEEE